MAAEESFEASGAGNKQKSWYAIMPNQFCDAE